ncbi:MAG TPA: L,D-transpeptidase family protein [Chthoniobacterales bacterium]
MFKFPSIVVLALGASTVAVLVWMNRVEPILSGTVDRILIEKSKRMMSLFRDGKILKTYSIALGFNPEGHKQQEGDGRTPEGIYWIDWRNPQSKYHLSLHISYPNAEDIQSAVACGVSPGCDIMIHGLPNGADIAGTGSLAMDWTAGCIAVTNAEIEEIWATVPDGAEVEILP